MKPQFDVTSRDKPVLANGCKHGEKILWRKRNKMEKDIIVKLQKNFEQQETDLEFWLARELQNLLGYAQWRSFEAVIEKAKTACKNSGHNPQDHFAQTRKMVDIGSGAASGRFAAMDLCVYE